MTKLMDEVRRLLRQGEIFNTERGHSERQIIRALTMLLNDSEELVRQRACWELGEMISRMAPSKVEDFICRLMWRLNPESGDNPVSVSEALGEIGVRAPQQIESFVPALMQYLDDEKLRPGLLQAAGRIGLKLPHAFSPYIDEIASYLRDYSLTVAGNAALALIRIGGDRSEGALHLIENDKRKVTLFCDNDYITIKLSGLDKQDCKRIEKLCVIVTKV